MFRKLHKIRGQNTAEYAILIGVVVAAAIAMQTYLRRAHQGFTKGALDHVANQNETEEIFTQGQYEPYYLDRDLDTIQQARREEEMQVGGALRRDILNETMRRTGYEGASNWTVGNE